MRSDAAAFWIKVGCLKGGRNLSGRFSNAHTAKRTLAYVACGNILGPKQANAQNGKQHYKSPKRPIELTIGVADSRSQHYRPISRIVFT